jgi:hypothetical protein
MDRVQSMLLDTLILSGAITKFKRSNGWVTIGLDPIRKQGQKKKIAEDRRSDLLTFSFL